MKKYVKVKYSTNVEGLIHGKKYEILNVKLKENYTSGIGVKIANDQGKENYYDASIFKFKRGKPKKISFFGNIN